MKFLPELQFEEDATLEQAAEIDRLIATLNAGDGSTGTMEDVGWVSWRAAAVLGSARGRARVPPRPRRGRARLHARSVGVLRARGTATVCSFPNEPLKLPCWASFLPGSDDLVEVADYPTHRP